MNATYLFAGLPVEIKTIYSYVHKYCAAYRTTQAPLFTISTEASDLAYEQARAQADDIREERTNRIWDEENQETLAVYRKIAERMPFYDTFLFHGSAIATEGEAFLFTAKSGTGKSTHTRLWREMLGEKAIIVNDDKPLISLREEGPMIHGTPYNGKHRLSTPGAFPLKALVVLKRGQENQIHPLTPAEAFTVLYQQVYRPADPEALQKTLALLNQLGQQVKLYELYCNMDPSAARLSWAVLTGREGAK